MSNVDESVLTYVITRLNTGDLSYDLNSNYTVFFKNLKKLCDDINENIKTQNYQIDLVPNTNDPTHIVLYNTRKPAVTTGVEDIDEMELDDHDDYDISYSAKIYINFKPSFKIDSNGGANKKTKRRSKMSKRTKRKNTRKYRMK